MIPHIIKTGSITLFPPNVAPIIINSDHMNFQAVLNAISDLDWDGAVELASVQTFVTRFTSGRITLTDSAVIFNGEPLNNYLSDKMLTFFRDGMPVEHYCKFLDNLMSNPSMTSRNQLYGFLEAADLPITEDGCFLAYKAVRSDFRDKHSGQFDNSPGVTHEMPRHNVDDDRDRTCSYGFHAAAYEYAKNFLGSSSDRMVAVKINPADVVSVPSDYGNQKLRCCRYTVMFEIPGAFEALKDMPYYDTSINSTPNNHHDLDTNTYFWGNIFDEDGDDDDYDDFQWDEDDINNPNRKV